MREMITTVLGEGFRALFLAAGLFSLGAMTAWELWLAAHAAGAFVVETPFAPPPHLWHAHEMVFGYAAAAIGGFFLTAAPSWTGAPAARFAFIAVATAAWLAGRLCMWFSGGLDPVLVALVDLAFPLIIASKLIGQLAKRPKPQNLMLLGILMLIWFGNLRVHLEWTGLADDGAYVGVRIGLFGVVALIAVIGGRVTPAFTRNAMLRAGRETALPRSYTVLDALGVVAALAVPIAIIAGAPDSAFGAVALTAGLAQGARLAHWRGYWTRRQPILWSLHLGYALLALGYVAVGLASFELLSEVAALHILGVGAVGVMTLAVMTRAALGHSGRPLVAPKALAPAFLLVAGSAILRAIGSAFGMAFYEIAVLGAGALWIIAFALFLAALWPILTTPRQSAATS